MYVDCVQRRDWRAAGEGRPLRRARADMLSSVQFCLRNEALANLEYLALAFCNFAIFCCNKSCIDYDTVLVLFWSDN